MSGELTADEREALAMCVWGIGTKTRSPLLPLLLDEVERILAARVADRDAGVREAVEDFRARAVAAIEECRDRLPFDWWPQRDSLAKAVALVRDLGAEADR